MYTYVCVYVCMTVPITVSMTIPITITITKTINNIMAQIKLWHAERFPSLDRGLPGQFRQSRVLIKTNQQTHERHSEQTNNQTNQTNQQHINTQQLHVLNC